MQYIFILQNAKNKDKDKALKEDEKQTATENKEVSANVPNAEINKNEDTKVEMEESILPIWLTRYLQFRFNLLDRTGIWKSVQNIKTRQCIESSLLP